MYPKEGRYLQINKAVLLIFKKIPIKHQVMKLMTAKKNVTISE